MHGTRVIRCAGGVVALSAPTRAGPLAAPSATLALAALLGFFAVGGRASAAPIAWGTATTLAGDTDVITTGSSVFAYNWANSNQTVNGQAFVGTTSGAPTGLSFSNMNFNNTVAFTTGSAPFADLSTAYKSILAGAYYNQSNNVTGTATLTNLTQGRSYAVQFWVGDPRGLSIPRNETLGGSGGNTVSLAFPLTTAGQMGQYSVGVFAADATSQSFTITPDNANTPPQVNALQLRDVTNIGAWTGINGATWDASTTANFASNLFSAALSNTTANVAQAALGSVVFGDAYWNSNASTTVTQTSVTIAAGGVSATTVRFANSGVNYTVTSSDTVGLTGSSMLMKGGTGTLTLAGTNSYTGGTFIGNGVLEFNNGSLGSTGSVGANGGTLRWASGNTQDISSRLVMQASATTTLDTNGNSVTLASAIGNSNSGSLVKVGSGTLTLSAASTYTGVTTVNAGTLVTVNLGSGSLTVNSGAKVSWTNAAYGNLNPTSILLDGGTLSLDGSTQNGHNFITRPITLRAGTLTSVNGPAGPANDGGNYNLLLNGGTLTVAGTGLSTVSMTTLGIANGGSFNVGDAVSGTGTDLLISSAIVNAQSGAGIVKNGAGTMELSGSNVFNGAVQINAGTVALSGTGSIASSSGVNVAASGAAFSISAATGNRTIAGLTGVAGSAVALGANTLTVSTTSSGTFAGGIAGTGGLTKAGTGLLALSGSNSHSGGTTLSAGTLALNNANALGSGTLTIAASTTLDNTSGGAIVNSGNNPQAWNGSFTFAGTNDLNLGTGAVTMSASLTGTVSSGTLSVGGAMNNPSYTLTKQGAGTLRVTGAMTLSNLYVSSGTMLLDGGSYTTTNPAGGNGLFVQSSPGAVLRLRNNATVSVANGLQIQQGLLDIDSGSVSVAGGSSPTLYIGNSATTATLTMTGGTVTTTNLEMGNGGASSTLNLNGGVLQIGANPVKQSGPVTLNMGGGTLRAGAAITIPSGLPFNLSGTNGNFTLDTQGFTVTATNAMSGVGGLIKAGSGTLALSASNSYSGGTTLNAGVLSFGTNALGSGNVTLASGTLQWASGNTQDISSKLVLVSGSTATLDTNGNSVTLGTGFGGSTSAALVKTGGGRLVLGGSNSFSGGTTLSSGTLAVNHAAGLGSGTLSIAASTTLDNTSGGAIVNAGNNPQVWNGSFTFAGTNDLNLGTGAVTISASTTLTVSAGTLALGGTIDNSSQILAKQGAGTLKVTGAVTLTELLVNGGTLLLDGGSYTAILAGPTKGLWIDNAGTTVLLRNNAAVSLPRRLRIGQGLLDMDSGSIAASSLYIGDSTGTAAFTMTGGTVTTSSFQMGTGGATSTLTLEGGVLQIGANPVKSTGAVALNMGGGTLQAGATITIPSGLPFSLTGTNGNFTLDTQSFTVTGSNAFSGVGGLIKAGAGTLTLSASNGYTGTTTISTGTLALSGAGGIASSAQVSIASGAALDISAATAATVDVNVLSGSGSVGLGSRTLRSVVSAGSGTFGGVISGSGGFTKAGAGTLSLTSIQDFDGPATVAGGVLAIASGTALQSASRIDVLAGATLQTDELVVVGGQTLGGYGTVDGDVTFNANSFLAPGGSVGALDTTGAVTFNGPFTYQFELNDADGVAGGPDGWDLYTTDGNFTFTGFDETNTFTVDLISLSGTGTGSAVGFNENDNYAWKFLVAGTGNTIEYTQSWFVVATTNFQNLNTNPERFSVVRGDQLGPGFGTGSSNELYVVYAAVPEPGTLALAGIGLALAVRALRRRARRP